MKRYNDLVSIVIPVYNVEKYLENCLKSIINQTYEKIEIILVDDGSTDNSGKICDKYKENDKRIKVIHKKNGGLSDARNTGIEAATGKYITFVDSDDDILFTYIEYLAYLIKKYKTKISIASYYVKISENKKYDIGKKYAEEKLSQEECLKRLLNEDGFSVSACSKLYELNLFCNIKYPLNKINEDNGTTYKLIMKCSSIAYGNKPIYNYYRRSNSIMTSSFNIRKLDMIELTDTMCDDVELKYPDLKLFCLRRRNRARFNILKQIPYVIKSNEDIQVIEKDIIKYLKKNKKNILFGKEYDLRDKIAILTLLINKNLYKFSWYVYDKIKN